MNVNMQIYSFLDTYTRSEITHHTMEPHLTVLSMTLPSHSNAEQMLYTIENTCESYASGIET